MTLTANFSLLRRMNVVFASSSAQLWDQLSFLIQSSMTGINAQSSFLTSLNMKSSKMPTNFPKSFPLLRMCLTGRLVTVLILLLPYVLSWSVVVTMPMWYMVLHQEKSLQRMRLSWIALSPLRCLTMMTKRTLRSIRMRNTCHQRNHL